MDATAAHQQSSRTCREHAALKASREAMRALSEPRHLTPPPHTLSKCKERTEEEDGRRSSLQTGNSQTYEPAAPSRLNRAEPLRWNGALRLVCNGPPAGGALAAVWLMAPLAVVGGLSPVGSRASVRHVSFCRTPSEELRWFLTCCRRSAPGDGRPLRGAGTRGGERPPEGLLVHSWRSCRETNPA